MRIRTCVQNLLELTENLEASMRELKTRDALKPNPAKPEPKFHRMDKGYVISTGGRDLVHLEFLKPEDFSLRSK